MSVTKILVVDKFLPWQSFVLTKLQSEGDLRISIASDGLEAIQKAKEQQPDVILKLKRLPAHP
jgi:CheY-like chemotaxis protein